MKPPIAPQPGVAMTRKQYWTLIASGGTTIVVWGASQFGGVDIPTGIGETMVMLAGHIVGYNVMDRANG